MNALIISLNFNPGHFSHLAACYKLYQDAGYTPYLYINSSFNKMDADNKFRKLNTTKELSSIGNISISIFWFPSLKNVFESLKLRFLNSSRVLYIYHEPFDSIKNYYRSGFGVKKIIKIILINIVNIPIIFSSHAIVLPSNAAFRLYHEKYTRLNKSYSIVPLLFDDELDTTSSDITKTSISYIGTIAADHAFDKFVLFVVSALVNNRFRDDIVFTIATASTIPEHQRQLLAPYLSSKRVNIFEGHPMSTAEINGHYNNSLVVWNAYHRSMQSGVLPKAYMFGAAVIVQTKNANEFIIDHETGILINDNSDVDEIRIAIDEIISQKDFFRNNCRQMFLKTFFYKANSSKFLSI